MGYEYVSNNQKMGIFLGKIFNKKKNAQENRTSHVESDRHVNTNNQVPYNKMAIDTMDGYTFEKYCAATLVQAGFTNVRHTKLSGDFGVDILAEYGSDKYAIQCKRYSKPVGVKAVQEVIGGAQYYNCNKAMIISNQYLTTQAVEMAQKTNTLFMSIENLVKMANDSLNGRKHEVLNITEEELRKFAMCIYDAFFNVHIYIRVTNINISSNEIVFKIQKEETVRLSKITSVKHDISYSLGVHFDMQVDFENQAILLIFNPYDIQKYFEKNKRSSESIDDIQENRQENSMYEESLSLEKDPLFEDAVNLIISKEKVSVGLIQRAFKIGFNRASNIIAQLEQNGIVSVQNDEGNREVLINIEQYKNIM